MTKTIYAAEIAAANDPDLRCFLVDFHDAPTPDDRVAAQPIPKLAAGEPRQRGAHIPRRRLLLRAGTAQAARPRVPIGLIHSSYGATPAEAWVSREGLSKDPGLNAMADKQIANMKAYPDK